MQRPPLRESAEGGAAHHVPRMEDHVGGVERLEGGRGQTLDAGTEVCVGQDHHAHRRHVTAARTGVHQPKPTTAPAGGYPAAEPS